MKTVTLMALVPLLALSVFTASAQDQGAAPPEGLPFVRDFDAQRYLGRWYEVARLPTRMQPAQTLAVAEYSAGKEAGRIGVKNTAFDVQGKKLAEIQGHARLAEGDPPGRVLVAFGPVLPDVPNYQVMYVDKDYQYAVVGVPDRQSLWILARTAPVGEEQLNSLKEVARKAGFDVSELIVAPWDRVAELPQAERDDAAEPAKPSR